MLDGEPIKTKDCSKLFRTITASFWVGFETLIIMETNLGMVATELIIITDSIEGVKTILDHCVVSATESSGALDQSSL